MSRVGAYGTSTHETNPIVFDVFLDSKLKGGGGSNFDQLSLEATPRVVAEGRTPHAGYPYRGGSPRNNSDHRLEITRLEGSQREPVCIRLVGEQGTSMAHQPTGPRDGHKRLSAL